jgi:hypothetical protein
MKKNNLYSIPIAIVFSVTTVLFFQNCDSKFEEDAPIVSGGSSSKEDENSSPRNGSSTNPPPNDNPSTAPLPNPPNGNPTNPPSNSTCGLTLNKTTLLVGDEDYSWSSTSSLNNGFVGQSNTVHGPNGDLIATHSTISNMGQAPRTNTSNLLSISLSMTPLLIDHPKVTIKHQIHESADGMNWTPCNATVSLNFYRRLHSEGFCELDPGLDETTCGGTGTKVFLKGVCRIIKATADPSLNNRLFQCVKTGGQTWKEVFL